MGLQVLALLTMKARIVELLLEGMTTEQRAAVATQVFEVLQHLNGQLDTFTALFTAGKDSAPPPA